MPPNAPATTRTAATAPTAMPTVFELPPEPWSLEPVDEVAGALVDVAVGLLVETAEELAGSALGTANFLPVLYTFHAFAPPQAI